jgi:hypothetical protein
MKHARLSLTGFSLIALINAPHADAGQTSGPVAALQSCRAIADIATRAACYDQAVDKLVAATASREVVIVDRTEVRNARKGLFGFTMPRIGFLAGNKDNAEDQADAARLETKIISSRNIGYGKWRFRVEDGATWETVETNLRFEDPVPGAAVVLERGTLGAYYATVGKGRRVQAKRIG